jgi:hypothetical protein
MRRHLQLLPRAVVFIVLTLVTHDDHIHVEVP